MLIYRSKSVPPKIRHSSLHLQTLDWNADDEIRNYQNAFVTQEITRRKGESDASHWYKLTNKIFLQHSVGMLFSLFFAMRY